MKDTLKRITVILVFWVFAGYLIYSMIIGKPLVQNQYENLNIIFYILLLAITFFLVFFYWITPIPIKFSRATLFVLWLWAIVMGKTIFLNDPLNNIFFGDLSCVMGVLLLIIGPTNLIITNKVKNTVQEKNIEIIEV